MADQEIIAAAHRDGEYHRGNHEHDDLLDARAEPDRVGRDQLEQPLIAANRRCDAGGQLGIAIRLPPHPDHADDPKTGGPRSDRDDSTPGISQYRARQYHEEIDE